MMSLQAHQGSTRKSLMLDNLRVRVLTVLVVIVAAAAYSLDDPNADHRAYAIERDEADDMVGCVASFRAALKYDDSSESLSNLATALLDERYEASKDDKVISEAEDLLKRAIAADSSNDVARDLLAELKGADTACTDDQIRYQLTPEDHSRGYLPHSTRERIGKVFAECGVIALGNAMGGSSAAFFKELQAEQMKNYRRWKTGKLDSATDAEERSKGRYEIRTPHAPPFVSSDLLKHPFIHPLAQTFLQSSRAEIDTLSSVVSLPNTKAQHWHRDAAALWSNKEVDLPPHGLVVFMPLIDVTMRHGPTEFLLKSHIPCEKHREVKLSLPDLGPDQKPSGGVWQLEECPWSVDRFVATAKAGDAIMFDVRILHRGGRNMTPKVRPMMYYSYVQEWWIDAVNFNSRQRKDFDAFDPAMRKLVTRLDSREYTQLLEKQLEKHGVNVAKLQSHYNYNRVDFKTRGEGVDKY